MIAQRTRGGRVTSLCFHGIGRPGRPLEPGEAGAWTAPGQFAEIAAAIAEHDGEVEITFDDGNESDYTHALPVLESLGLTAEFFVIAGRLDTGGSLSTDQLTGLADAGMRIGSHGMWHRPWRTLRSDQDFHEEMVTARRTIEDRIGAAIDHAACPLGSYDRRVLSELRRSGYSRVYLIDGGRSPAGAWARDRHGVGARDSAESVAAYLANPDGSRSQSVIRSGKRVIKRLR